MRVDPGVVESSMLNPIRIAPIFVMEDEELGALWRAEG